MGEFLSWRENGDYGDEKGGEKRADERNCTELAGDVSYDAIRNQTKTIERKIRSHLAQP